MQFMNPEFKRQIQVPEELQEEKNLPTWERSSHLPQDLNCRENISGIPSLLLTIFHPILIGPQLLTSLLLPFFGPLLQLCHLFWIGTEVDL